MTYKRTSQTHCLTWQIHIELKKSIAIVSLYELQLLKQKGESKNYLNVPMSKIGWLFGLKHHLFVIINRSVYVHLYIHLLIWTQFN